MFFSYIHFNRVPQSTGPELAESMIGFSGIHGASFSSLDCQHTARRRGRIFQARKGTEFSRNSTPLFLALFQNEQGFHVGKNGQQPPAILLAFSPGS
jgi:hypothetical protein